MAQSKYRWVFVYEDGTTETIECTWDELWDKSPNREPIAIVKGDFV